MQNNHRFLNQAWIKTRYLLNQPRLQIILISRWEINVPWCFFVLSKLIVQPKVYGKNTFFTETMRLSNDHVSLFLFYLSCFQYQQLRAICWPWLDTKSSSNAAISATTYSSYKAVSIVTTIYFHQVINYISVAQFCTLWKQKWKCYVLFVNSIRRVLSLPIESLSDKTIELKELACLIGGTSSITSGDLAEFCMQNQNRWVKFLWFVFCRKIYHDIPCLRV